MKTLTVRGAWALLMFTGGKNIENRSRLTHHRGDLLIHCASTWTRKEHDFVERFVRSRRLKVDVPAYEDIPLGQIIGRVTLADCVPKHSSKWWMGQDGTEFQPEKEQWAWVLENPVRAQNPMHLKGKLGIFDAPIEQRGRKLISIAGA